MNSRERLLTVLKGGIPDCVPVAPDFSNMIPAKLTGMPFWDIYLYRKKPIWEAYLDCAKKFNIDTMMDGHCPLVFPEKTASSPEWINNIVHRTEDMIVTQKYHTENGKKLWRDRVDVYYRGNPPTNNIRPEKIGLPDIPAKWEPLEGVNEVDMGPENFMKMKKKLGNQGLIGTWLTYSSVLNSEESIYDFYDNPEKYEKLAVKRVEDVEERFKRIMAMPERPDFLCVGGSGSLVFQTVDIFRKISFPAVKRGIELATAAGMPTHIHSCGPEKELVKIMAEETTLTSIDPLEIPPMGDCDLKELKRLYGNKITLKGNLHTTEVMLKGSVEDVIEASKKAIDDAAKGGRFILSTGDQCGRDTPFENLEAMVETARTYGKYD